MFKKSLSLEQLLEQLSIAEKNFQNANSSYQQTDLKYKIAFDTYIEAKHAYERALQDYIDKPVAFYSFREIESRLSYANASTTLSQQNNELIASKKRLKKATKVVKKLQKQILKNQEQPQREG